MTRMLGPVLILLALVPGALPAQALCELTPEVGEVPVAGGEAVTLGPLPVLSDGRFVSSLLLTDRRLIAAPHPDVPGPMEAPDDAEWFSAPLRAFDRSAVLDASVAADRIHLRVRFARGAETRDRELVLHFCPSRGDTARALAERLRGATP